MKPIRATNEDASSLQWAGLPIEYWIDINIFEFSTVSEILQELVGKFPELSREKHISLISQRLTNLAQVKEIGFQLGVREVWTNLSAEEGLTRLKLSQTWDENGEEALVAFFKKVPLSRKLSNLWNRIRGKPFTGRYSSVRRS
jgi:hypothetical protein